LATILSAANPTARLCVYLFKPDRRPVSRAGQKSFMIGAHSKIHSPFSPYVHHEKS
jgi:hypothetical protein